MKEHISNSALINAIISINNDIKRQKKYLDSADISEDECGDEGEALLEMEKAFGEFYSIYKERTKFDSALPRIEDLIGEVP
jgi:hypothetical protein